MSRSRACPLCIIYMHYKASVNHDARLINVMLNGNEHHKPKKASRMFSWGPCRCFLVANVLSVIGLDRYRKWNERVKPWLRESCEDRQHHGCCLLNENARQWLFLSDAGVDVAQAHLSSTDVLLLEQQNILEFLFPWFIPPLRSIFFQFGIYRASSNTK